VTPPQDSRSPAQSTAAELRKRPRGDGALYQARPGGPWVMRLYIPALRRHKKRSARTTDRQKAEKKLSRWRIEVEGGTWLSDADRTTFKLLAQMLEDDYRTNRRRSADRLDYALVHLRAAFESCRARAITTDRVLAYTRERQAAGAANATINRELAALKRMFRLGEIAGKVARRPHIPMLREENTRTGFFEREAFDTVCGRIAEHLPGAMTTAYITGWRIHSEILTRQKPHLDLVHGRLEPGETKNGEGRMFPLTPELRAVLEAQLERTRALERETGRIIPWLFHRDGKPIKSFRRAWRTACRLAGVPGRIPHDFRRTAIRNLERAGVPRSAAMKMVGHRTESVYRRYAIVDEAMLRESGEKLARLKALERGGVAP
jgi:integrase